MPDDLDLKVSVAKTPLEIEDIRSFWEIEQTHPNSDLDFFQEVISCSENIVRPHVIAVSCANKPHALLVGRIENSEITLGIGYHKFVKKRCRMFVSVFGGLIGRDSDSVAKAIIAELLDTLKRREVEIVSLRQLKVDSYLYNRARTTPGLLSRDYFCDKSLHWYIDLPSNFEDFQKKLPSKKRKDLRRLERKLRTDSGGQVKLKIFRYPAELEEFLRDAESIASLTYQRKLGVGFSPDKKTRTLLQFLSLKEMFRGYILYVNEKACAFSVETVYKGACHGNHTGYDPSFARYSPGILLFLKVVEDLYATEEIDFYDFGAGHAAYKKLFSDQYFYEADVLIFPADTSGIALNVTKAGFLGTYKLLDYLLVKLDVRDKIKKMCRRVRSPDSIRS